MKTTKLVALCAFISVSAVSYSNIHTVNNASPSPGQYTTIAAGVAAASPGDTLMVAGTDVSYGHITLDKALTILGPGWVVSGGGISRVAIFGNISITSDNTRIIGLRASNVISAGYGNAVLSNITVQRCIIDVSVDLTDDDWSGALIEGNVFSTWNGWNLSSNSTSYDFLNCEVRNNIFNGAIYSGENNNVEHNLFLGQPGFTNIASSGWINGTFQGNISVYRYNSSVVASNNITGNLAWSAGNYWVSGGNFNDVDPVFVSYTANTIHNWAYDYHLQGGSPAIGNGPAGEDIGLYDGDGVYRIDGEPSIPIVRAVNVPGGAVVPANATFNVNIISVAHE